MSDNSKRDGAKWHGGSIAEAAIQAGATSAQTERTIWTPDRTIAPSWGPQWATKKPCCAGCAESPGRGCGTAQNVDIPTTGPGLHPLNTWTTRPPVLSTNSEYLLPRGWENLLGSLGLLVPSRITRSPSVQLPNARCIQLRRDFLTVLFDVWELAGIRDAETLASNDRLYLQNFCFPTLQTDVNRISLARSSTDVDGRITFPSPCHVPPGHPLASDVSDPTTNTGRLCGLAQAVARGLSELRTNPELARNSIVLRDRWLADCDYYARTRLWFWKVFQSWEWARAIREPRFSRSPPHSPLDRLADLKHEMEGIPNCWSHSQNPISALFGTIPGASAEHFVQYAIKTGVPEFVDPSNMSLGLRPNEGLWNVLGADPLNDVSQFVWQGPVLTREQFIVPATGLI